MLADFYGLRLVSAAGAVRTIASSRSQSTPQGVGVLAQMPFILAINRGDGVAVDPAGNVVVADQDAQMVRRISPADAVTLAAGLVGSFGGAVDGVGSAAQFAFLSGAIASDSTGALYVGDGFGALRRIGTDNATTLLAGSATAFGAVDGNGAAARFNIISGLAVGTGGNVFVGDFANNAVRRVDSAGNVTTYAGVMGQSGRVDGPIATARFQAPRDLALGPDGALYVNDNGTIRKVTPDGATVSTVGAAGGQVNKFALDSAGTIYFDSPSGLFMLPSGGVATLLIPHTSGNVVLGSSPQLPNVNAMAVLGPKQIVMVSGAQILVATLP